MPSQPPLCCPACSSSNVKLATDAIYVVYLRCEACFHVWSMPKEEYARVKKENEEKRKN